MALRIRTFASCLAYQKEKPSKACPACLCGCFLRGVRLNLRVIPVPARESVLVLLVGWWAGSRARLSG